MFVERSIQYTSFSSRKQPENAGTERKQFTENASVALQQPILTHAHTKCPPVGSNIFGDFSLPRGWLNISNYFFSKLASGRNPPNPAI